MAEKKFERLLKKMLDSPPPGYEFQPKLVPIDQNSQPADNNSENKAASGAPVPGGTRS
jgi:hypothetical protein